MVEKKKSSNIQKVELHREILRSRKRFFALFLLVMIAVGFLSGLRVTAPDMKHTVALYFQDKNLMDVQLLSTIGWKKDTPQKLLQSKRVLDAEGGYRCDLKWQGKTVSLYSLPDQIDRLWLKEGRLPNPKSKEAECVVEQRILTDGKYKIGDSIPFTGDKKRKDLPRHLTYRICGVVASPVFLTDNHGTSSVGSGTVEACVYLPKKEFSQDAYSFVVATFQGTKQLDAYTRAYDKEAKKSIDSLKEETKELLAQRKEQLTKEIDKKVAEKVQSTVSSKMPQVEKQISMQLEQEMQKAVALRRQNALSLPNEGEVQKTKAALLEDAKKRMEEEATGAAQKAAAPERKRIEEAGAYLLGRDKNAGYMLFSSDADRMAALGDVFPIIFYLVATLSCLTSLTRMVEEERTEIGVWKAMGYSPLSIGKKYLSYAFYASFLGGLTGLIWGSTLVPMICMSAWTSIYDLPSLKLVPTPFIWFYSLGTAIFLLVGTAALICGSGLKETPAELMRPRAPKAGKRILLERMPFWKRLRFLTKVMFRNLFRYKIRFLMTTLGVLGCTALLVTGLGLYDAIYSVMSKQFDEIIRYQAVLKIDEGLSGKQYDSLLAKIRKNPLVAEHFELHTDSCKVAAEGVDAHPVKDVSLYVVEDPDRFAHDFFTLQTGEGKNGQNELKENKGVLITRKMADLLHVKKGDEIRLQIQESEEDIGEETENKKEEKETIRVRVAGIVENYFNHYVFMSRKEYRSLTGRKQESSEINTVLLKYRKGLSQAEQLKDSGKLATASEVSSYERIGIYRQQIENSLMGVNAAVMIIIVAAGALACVVLFNLTNMNISERNRELATLRVLGFHIGETSSYVTREGIFMTVTGILGGLAAGRWMLIWLMKTVEADNVMFGRNASLRSYLIATALTFFVSLLVNRMVTKMIRKMDMVTSLKAVE